MKKCNLNFTLQCTGKFDIENDAFLMENTTFEVNTEEKIENYKHKAVVVSIMAATIEHITGINVIQLIEQQREIENLY